MTKFDGCFADNLIWKELRTTGQKFIPRAGHTTVALRKHLFVFGGFTDDRRLFDDLHVLNVGMCSRISCLKLGDPLSLLIPQNWKDFFDT